MFNCVKRFFFIHSAFSTTAQEGIAIEKFQLAVNEANITHSGMKDRVNCPYQLWLANLESDKAGTRRGDRALAQNHAQVRDALRPGISGSGEHDA